MATATRTAERTEFLSDIVIGAVEGGTGYWAAVAGYKWEGVESARATLILDDDETYVWLSEFEAENGRKAKGSDLIEAGYAFKLDVGVVAKGLGKIRRGEVQLNAALRATILAADRENDGAEIDADGADVIVQAGLFGEVVYG